MPARVINWWLAISASAGASFRVFRWYLEARIVKGGSRYV
ncbi:Uncharacterised protein [Bordetella pertussis]|nr:Uncharacterised protein [Bordetella pertussis]CFW29668.1 Uncharacterised protein [Bordetella pertussis]